MDRWATVVCNGPTGARRRLRDAPRRVPAPTSPRSRRGAPRPRGGRSAVGGVSRAPQRLLPGGAGRTAALSAVPSPPGSGALSAGLPAA